MGLISTPTGRLLGPKRCFRRSGGLVQCSPGPEKAVEAVEAEAGDILTSDGNGMLEHGVVVEPNGVDGEAQGPYCDLEVDSVLQKELKENGNGCWFIQDCDWLDDWIVDGNDTM